MFCIRLLRLTALRMCRRRKADPMPKPISRPLHGVADYSYVALVSAAPQLFGFAEEQSASLLCRVLSASALVYSIFTRAEWGFIRAIPYKAHLALDTASGVFSFAAPWLFGFSQNARARNTFLSMGAAGLIAGLLSEPQEMPEEEK